MLFNSARQGNPSRYPPASTTPPRFVLWSDHERRYFFRVGNAFSRGEEQFIENAKTAKSFASVAEAEAWAKKNNVRHVRVVKKT